MTKRNPWRILAMLWAAWLCVLCALPGPAAADETILHTPAAGQIQRQEAIRIACEVIHEKTGVELTGLYRVKNGMKIKGQVEAYFGPGWQWLDNSDIQEDCWVLILQNETRIRKPVVVLHGTTGEVLHWRFSDRETDASYVDLLPEDGQMTLEEARQLVMERFGGLTGGDDLFVAVDFGWGDSFSTRWGALPHAPVWNLYASRQVVEGDSVQVLAQYQLVVDARSREVLLEVVTDFSYDPPVETVLHAGE